MENVGRWRQPARPEVRIGLWRRECRADDRRGQSHPSKIGPRSSLSRSGRVETLAFRRRLQHARRVLSLGDGGLSRRRAYGYWDPSAFGVDNEISTTGTEWRRGQAGARFDLGYMRAARGPNHERACGPGPCTSLLIDPTAGDDQSPAAVVEREDGTPPDGGVSAFEETVLGTAPVGTRMFLLQFKGKTVRLDDEIKRRGVALTLCAS